MADAPTIRPEARAAEIRRRVSRMTFDRAADILDLEDVADPLELAAARLWSASLRVALRLRARGMLQ